MLDALGTAHLRDVPGNKREKMEKVIQIYLMLLLLVFLVACQRQDQTVEPKDSIRKTESDLSDSTSVMVNYNTITAPNAPARITRNIKLDSEGNLLIAAYDDIVRYDGNSFTHLGKKEGLDSWYAFDVLEDKKGNIWIASDQAGAFRIDVATGIITNFTTNEGLAHRRNMCIYEDKTGNIWIGGQGGLSRYDGKAFVNFTTEDGLPHNDINTIIEDRTGKIWFGTRGNAGVYDGNTFYEIKNDEGIPFFNVWSITEDIMGNIWLIDTVGLWQYSGGSFTHISSGVWKIYEDTHGIFWSTGMLRYGGSVLKRIDSKSLFSKKTKAVEVFKANTMFFGIAEDMNGSIWIGGNDGIWCYNGSTVSYFTGIIAYD